MQSWGVSSRFKKLSTEREPTKSGVIGLIAAALGRERNEGIDDLCHLQFGVRIDQPGQLIRDYHTARNPNDAKLAFISERYYLCDAVFVVGLGSNNESFLEKIREALLSPRFPLYLGRRSCPPSGQIVLGITQLSLEEALKIQEWKANNWYMKRRSREENIDLEIVVDVPFGAKDAYLKRDVPLSFNEEFRRYGFRSLSSDVKGVSVRNPLWYMSPKAVAVPQLAKHKTDHDPFLALEVGNVLFES